MKKRIYIVQDNDGAEDPRMVSATSQAVAIGHVVRGRYKARVANALEVHELTNAGTKLEKAGEATEDPSGDA